MKIKLVFDDWRNRQHQSVYATSAGIDLTLRDFHSGTTFEATIELDAESEAELIEALA